jgi:aarF domain-containing kinase
MWLIFVILVLAYVSAARPESPSVSSGYGRVISEAKDQNIDKMALENWDMEQVVSSHGRSDSTGNTLKSPIITMWDIIMRATYLFLLFQPVLWTMPLAFFSAVFRNVVWFNLVAITVSHSGAAFIKWGQWASTRPDMFPEEFCVALSELHANGKEHSFAYTTRAVHTEFGASIDSVFEDFSRTPVASGSIAQVYKARYKNREVAVKVRHPGVEVQIDMDFTIMKSLARLVESVPGLAWINLSESLLQFSHTISSQTNLAAEGIHLAIFNRNFKGWCSRVGFPKPILLSSSVLVESFEEGRSVSEYTSLYNSQRKRRNSLMGAVVSAIARLSSGFSSTSSGDEALNRVKVKSLKNTQLAHTIVAGGEDLYLKMLLVDNLMHADFHPGNIMIQEAGAAFGEVERGDAKIVLVDAGMVAKLTSTEQDNFIGLLEAMGAGSGREAAEHVMNFAEGAEYSGLKREAFSAAMDDLFLKKCRGYGTGADVGVVLRGMLRLVREYEITIEANYATLVMNALCLDGLATQLIPGYKVLDGAKTMLQYHRGCKRFGRFVGRLLFYTTLPLTQFAKRAQDRKYARNLKKGINLHARALPSLRTNPAS